MPQDYAKAVKWWSKAAEQSDVRAQYNLGGMYANGRGVPQNYAEAVKWWPKAAEQGDASAQHNLGVTYAMDQISPTSGSFSLGVPQDYAAAHMWFTLAVAQGHKNAQKALEILVRRMTHSQIEEARLMTREWRAQHQQ